MWRELEQQVTAKFFVAVHGTSVLVAVRLRRLILLFFAYGSTKPEKIAYGSSFGKSPPTPRGVCLSPLVDDFSPHESGGFMFSRSRKPYGPAPCVKEAGLRPATKLVSLNRF